MVETPDRKVIGRGLILEGDPAALEAWADALKFGGDPWIERGEPTHDVPSYVLRSRRLDTADKKTVYNIADSLIRTLNGIINLIHRKPLAVRSNRHVLYLEGGGRMFTLSVTVAWAIRKKINSPIPLPEMTAKSPCTWQHLSDYDEFVSDAVTSFGRAEYWYDLWETFETVEAGTPDGRKGIVRQGWSTREDCDLFAITANHHRHSRHAKKAPRIADETKLMSLADGHAFMAMVLHHWLEYRRSLMHNGNGTSG